MKINWNFLGVGKGTKNLLWGEYGYCFSGTAHWKFLEGGGGLKSQLKLLEEKHETKIKLEFLGGSQGDAKKNL